MRSTPLGIGYASEAAVEFADRSMEADRLPRHPRLDRAWPRSAAPTRVSRVEVGSRPAADRHHRAPGRGARRGDRGRSGRDARLGTGPRGDSRPRHAQQQLLAIAPTATISTIQGVSQSIEPLYKNLYVKSNLSGEFTLVNERAGPRPERARPVGRDDARRAEVLRRLAARRSSASPTTIKERYLTAFEIDPELADRLRRPPAEVDRHGAIAQPLHRRAERPQVERDVPARLADRV